MLPFKGTEKLVTYGSSRWHLIDAVTPFNHMMSFGETGSVASYYANSRDEEESAYSTLW